MNLKAEEAVFAVALALPQEQRAAYLDQACAGKTQLGSITLWLSRPR